MSQLIQCGHRDYKGFGSVQASCSAAAVRFVRFLGRWGRCSIDGLSQVGHGGEEHLYCVQPGDGSINHHAGSK